MTTEEAAQVRNPATGEVLARIPTQTPAEVAAAVARARQAQGRWAALPLRTRARLLRRFARSLREDALLMETLVAESGKPRYEAEAIELFYTLELTRSYTSRRGRAHLADDLRRPFLFRNKRARVTYVPRGVVGVIGPWNWPLLNNYADAVAPLLAGNSVVLKPSPVTPLTSLRVEALWRDLGMPDDVFQVVTGNVEAGQALVDHVDMVFFTGSVAAGRQVARRAGERLIPCALELGGKSAMVVLRDADLSRAAHAAVWSAFAHSGQVCIRTERVFVERPVASRFLDLCAAEMVKLRQGTDPEQTDVRAVTFAPQVARCEAQVADALAKGARLITGGKRLDHEKGQFFAPTLLAEVNPDMAVMNEETFGPLLPVMTVADAEEALTLANQLELGLSGSIWSQNIPRARRLARRLEAGSVCINDALFNYFIVEAPLGGIKQSGLGVRHGAEGLRQFCRVETIVEDAPVLGRLSPILARELGFPYRRKTLELIRRVMRWLY